MSTIIPSIDEFSRPAKALIDSGKVAEFGEAGPTLAASVPTIAVGADAGLRGHQAAILTAVEVTIRAFEEAPVHVPAQVAGSPCLLPGLTHLSLADAVLEAGGQLVDEGDASIRSRPVIAIGAAEVEGATTLQVTWDRWVAHVDTIGTRLPERGNMILAPVAAAGLAVTECFERVLGVHEACYRRRTINLWRPEVVMRTSDFESPSVELLGPDLKYLPAAVWLVGLGHVGQAFAWCWRLLPFVDPTECLIQLQDFDKVTEANRSTGLMIRRGDLGRLKTRVVAEALELAGFGTRIVERPLLPETRRHPLEPELALIGVDKPEPRRLISDVGWAFAVDVGLGAGPIDFTAISIHTFPGPIPSGKVVAWQRDVTRSRVTHAQEQDAYRTARSQGADQCGLVQLAEAAVAAPFVGVVAACLALAEPLRVLHGHAPNATLAYDSGRGAVARTARGTATPRIAFLNVART